MSPEITLTMSFSKHSISVDVRHSSSAQMGDRSIIFQKLFDGILKKVFAVDFPGDLSYLPAPLGTRWR
jgi:hypothetical protein